MRRAPPAPASSTVPSRHCCDPCLPTACALLQWRRSLPGRAAHHLTSASLVDRAGARSGRGAWCSAASLVGQGAVQPSSPSTPACRRTSVIRAVRGRGTPTRTPAGSFSWPLRTVSPSERIPRGRTLTRDRPLGIRRGSGAGEPFHPGRSHLVGIDAPAPRSRRAADASSSSYASATDSREKRLRGSTRLIRPKGTRNSWGSSSRWVRRRKRPTRVGGVHRRQCVLVERARRLGGNGSQLGEGERPARRKNGRHVRSRGTRRWPRRR